MKPPVRKSERLIFAVGIMLLMAGLMAVLKFEILSRPFLSLSQDGLIVPQTLLQLRLVLIALGILGIAIIFRRRLKIILAQIDGTINKYSIGKFLIIVLCLAAFWRLVALFMPFHLWGDWKTYHDLAVTWAETGSFSWDGVPYAYRPPGYPYLLSRLYLLFGEQARLGALANIIFSLAIVLLTYLIARRVFGDRAARWSAFILALFPSQILFVNKLASETMFTALLFGAIYLFVLAQERKAVWSLAAGVVLGLATLTRGVTHLYLIIPLAAFYLARQQGHRWILKILFSVIGMAVVVVPWMYRNLEEKGKFAVSLNSGINFLIGNAPGSGMGWNQSITEKFDIDNPYLQAANDSLAWSLGWEYVRQNPVGFFKRGILKVMYSFGVDMEGVWNELTEAAEKDRFNRYILVALIAETYYLLVLLGFLAGVLVYLKDRKLRSPGAFTLWTTVLYFTAIIFVFFGDGRFHFPVIPIMAIFAGLAIERNSHPEDIESEPMWTSTRH